VDTTGEAASATAVGHGRARPVRDRAPVPPAFLRERRSGLLAGIGTDAVSLADDVVAHLGRVVADA
jgi:hypothetical protein